MPTLRQLKAEIFQALGQPTRLAILETLQDGELTVGAILVRLGKEHGNVSQHLAILRARRLVITRKEGNRVHYALRDPVLGEVLALMRRYAAGLLSEDLAMLEAEMAGPRPRRPRRSTPRPAGRADGARPRPPRRPGAR